MVVYWRAGPTDGSAAELRIVRLDGSDQRTLLDGEDGELADPPGHRPPTCSSTGGPWGRQQLLSVTVTDEPGRQAAPAHSRKYFDQGPSWSPDGTQIAFRRGIRQGQLADRDGRRRLERAESSGSNDGYAASPVWTAR